MQRHLALDLLKVWKEYSDPYHLPVVLASIGNDPFCLYSLLARGYEVYDLLKNTHLAPEWSLHCENHLLESHSLGAGSFKAITRLKETEPPIDLCLELLLVHEKFMASTMGKKLLRFFPLEAEDEKRLFLIKIREGIQNQEFTQDQLSVRAFPQFGRVLLFARVYDSVLTEDNEVEWGLLEDTEAYLCGQIQAWEIPKWSST